MRQIAAAAGMTSSTLQRQLDREIKVQTLIAICRAYRKPLIPCLVAAGYLTDDEGRQVSIGGSIREATDRDLAEEILRRVVAGEATSTLTDPLDVDLDDEPTAKGA